MFLAHLAQVETQCVFTARIPSVMAFWLQILRTCLFLIVEFGLHSGLCLSSLAMTGMSL